MPRINTKTKHATQMDMEKDKAKKQVHTATDRRIDDEQSVSKSVMELLRNRNENRRKITKVGVWNVRGMNNKETELETEMKRMKLDILAVC